MQNPARVLLVALLAGLAGCGRSPHLAGGPIALSERPTTIRLAQPVQSHGPTWELCFEFDRPGDSRQAAGIRTTLVASSGSRAMLRNPTLDRRGESTVCQIGRLDPPQGTEGTVYDSIELSSDRALRLRGIRGGNRS